MATPVFDPSQPFDIVEPTPAVTTTPPAFGGTNTIPKPDTAGMYNEPKFTSEPNPQLTQDAKGEPIIPKMGEVAKGIGMGLLNLPMGLGELVVDMPFGTDYFKTANKERAKKVEEMGVEGPAGAASLVTSLVPGTLVLKFKPIVIGATEALTMGATAIGEDKSDVEAAAMGAFGLAGAYIPAKIAEVLTDPTGRASKYLIEKMGLTPEEAELLIKGLPADKDKQALALANMGGDRTVGSIKRVGQNSDAEALKLYEDLQARVKVMLETIGPVDVNLQRARYRDISTKIELKNPVTHDASGIADNLDFLERFYGATPSKANTLVAQMKAIISDGKGLKVSDAMEFTRDLNYLISKTSRGKEKVKLNEIKQNIDGFLSKTLDEADKRAFTMMNREYADTMNNAALLDLVNKSTVGERGINWAKLSENITKEGLNSHEVSNALAIAREFTKRFGSDHKLVAASGEKSTNLNTGGFLGTTSYVINKALNMGAMWGERHNAVVVQNAISRALKKGGNELDFVNNLKSSKFVPTKFVDDMELLLRTPIRDIKNQGIVKQVNHTNPNIELRNVGDDVYRIDIGGVGSRVTDSQMAAWDAVHSMRGTFELPPVKLDTNRRFRTSYSMLRYAEENPERAAQIFSADDIMRAEGNVRHLQNLVEKGETKLPGDLGVEELKIVRDRFESPAFREQRLAREAQVAEEARVAREAT